MAPPCGALVRMAARPFRLGEMQGHTDGVNYMRVSTKPPLVVTAGEDKTARVWKPTGEGHWRSVQVLKGHDKGVYGVAIAGKARFIATASADQSCCMWGLRDDGQWHRRDKLLGHTGFVHSVEVSEDGSVVVTPSADCTCRVWSSSDFKKWQCKQVLRGHGASVYGAALASDLSLIMTASDDKTCRVWAKVKDSWVCQHVLEGHTQGLSSVKLAVDGRHAATVSDDKTCRVWARQQAAWRCEHVLAAHAEGVLDVAMAPDMSLIATSSYDTTCRLWAVSNGTWTCRQVLRYHRKPVYGIMIEALGDGELIVGTGSEDERAALWRYDGRNAYLKTQIRSATDCEIILCFIVLVTSLLQRLSFAFNSRVPFTRTTRKIVAVTFQWTMFDLHIPTLQPEVQLYGKTIVAIAAIWTFLLCALAGRGKLTVRLVSTVCVMPIIKQLLTAVSCSDGAVDVCPSVHCFEGDHLKLSFAAAGAAVVYLALLVPFTAAEGDLKVMPPYVWLRPKEWARRKVDKILGIDHGRLNLSPQGALSYSYATLVAGLALPIIRAATRASPLSVEILLSGVVSLVPLFAAVCRPPRESLVINYFIVVTNMLTTYAFGAALFALVHDDGESTTPTQVLLAGWACVAALSGVLAPAWGRWLARGRGGGKQRDPEVEMATSFLDSPPRRP